MMRALSLLSANRRSAQWGRRDRTATPHARRSRGKPAPRTVAVLLAVIFAIAAPSLQAVLGLGLSPAQFSARGDETLRAAGYAFSIWSVIYLALAGYAVWQALPRTPESPFLQRVAWPSALGIAGCGAWIVVTALDRLWLSVLVIVICATAILTAVLRGAAAVDRSAIGQRLSLAALGALGGWLTAATALNVLMAATAQGLIEADTAMPTALAALAGVLGLAGFVVIRTGLFSFAAAVIWALVAIWVAERRDAPVAAWAALAGAGLLGLGAAWRSRTRRT